MRSETSRSDGFAGLQFLESPEGRWLPTLALAESAGNLGLVWRSLESLA